MRRIRTQSTNKIENFDKNDKIKIDLSTYDGASLASPPDP
jgi:hypothetical protein